ncbi:ABC transporter substrate-binding protein [Chelativorans sp. ZYF759]|uniref:TAXI family TRAP transporter solute-binding subunit n=1 Tax=Chelativorans sp. ZYF759 TaxID=2692213 RepID=UPI00145D5B16|nr:TAXI family TRAP transporter solute-binding subunit [Chelativorans sp. ZYF759]NMG39658.1 ABC transporter substrate-binding protein [Chelativorans sp. ZYF759]
MSRYRTSILAGLAGVALTIGLMAGTANNAAAEDNYEWPQFFNVITPIVGTANHSLAVAWTGEFTAQTGSRARVLPAPNGFSRAAWLNQDEGRIVLVQASDYFDQMDAADGYATRDAGPTDTRMINMNQVTGWGYMVRGDSAIESFNDIGPGTRVSYSPSSSFLISGVQALLAYRDLTPEDVTLVEVGNYGANTAVIPEGRADVTFTSPTSGPSYEAEAGPNSIRWLPLPREEEDPEAFARYRAQHPGYVAMEVESGVTTSHGLYMDHAFQANHVRADEDPEFVYQLLKWMDEQHDSFKEDFTHAHMMSIDNLVAFLDNGALQPLHEGAIRYLEEIGRWTEAHQTRQDQLVEMAQAQEAGYRAAIEAAEAEGIAIEPDNQAWIDFWRTYRAENGLPENFGQAVLALN